MEDGGISPGSDSTGDHIDLSVSEHSSRTLREGRHRRTSHPIGGGVSNRGIVRDRQENGIAQSNRRSPLAATTMTCRAVLRV